MAETANHEQAREIAELKKLHAVPEQKMETRRQEYRTDIGRLAEEMARRDSRLIISVLGIMVAGITILGFILTSMPAP